MTDFLRGEDNVSRIGEAEKYRRDEARMAFLGAIDDYIDQEIQAAVKERVTWQVGAAFEKFLKSGGIKQAITAALQDVADISVSMKLKGDK